MSVSWGKQARLKTLEKRKGILKPKKAGLNCSVIHLQLTWKTHHQTSTWSWWSFNAVTRWRQHAEGNIPVGAAEFPRLSPTQGPSCLPAAHTSLCVAAHTCVNNCSLWWRSTKLPTGLVLLTSTFTQPWGCPQLRAWPQTWWTCI